jgi:hypothetical protein
LKETEDMSGALIFRLVLLVLVAIAWAWLAFRAVTAEGGFGAWLRAPETKRDRSTLALPDLRACGDGWRCWSLLPAA